MNSLAVYSNQRKVFYGKARQKAEQKAKLKETVKLKIPASWSEL
jgi:hypothetical protein